MAFAESQSPNKNAKSNKKKIVVIALALTLFGAMGAGLGLLWNQLKMGRSGQESGTSMDRELLKQLLKKYSDAGQFEEAFSLLNEALRQSPYDQELQQELGNMLAQKQQADREQQDAQRQLSENLMKQNAALQSHTDALQEQLSRQLGEMQRENQADREAQKQEQEKRKAEARRLVRQGQEALARSLKASKQAKDDSTSATERQKARLTAIAEAKDAEEKAVKVLELDDSSKEARDLLKQAQAALRQNESLEEQNERQDAENEIERLHKELAQVRKNKDSAKIDRLVGEILDKDPLDSEANTAKAKRIEETQGSEARQALKNAESAYRKALTGDPEHEEALAGLAQNLDKQERLEEAVKAYDKALENPEDPYDSELAYYRGVTLYRLGRFQEAADGFDEYLQQGGKNLRAYYGLGLSYQRLARSRKALQTYTDGIAKGLKHAATFWELAKLQLEAGKTEQALASVNSALALKKEDSRYLQTKGAILFEQKRYEEAAETYAEADKTEEDIAEKGQVNYNLGLSYYNSDQFPKAESAFNKAISLDKNKSEYILGLADAQIAGGKSEAAQKTLSVAEQQFPDNADLLLTRGNISLKMKEYDKALEIFQKAYDKDPQNRKIINNLGLAYMNTKRFDQSRKFFLKAISGDPDNSTLWFNLALVNIATEDHTEAIDNLEKTVSLDSKMSEAYYLLAKVYLVDNQKDKAVKTLSRLRAADPRYPKIVELENLLNN